MKIEHFLPADIERTSMTIITKELFDRQIKIPKEHEIVVKRVIHTTADFDYASALCFTEDAVIKGVAALQQSTPIITDTNMAKAGISKPSLKKVGSTVHCFMADEDVAKQATVHNTTRAVASMKKAAMQFPNAIYAVGNAPTALFQLEEQIKQGQRPALVIGVPVGFVNVEESKLRIFDLCVEYHIPAIVAMGRKGGSNVAAAICNAILYAAINQINPSDRGWL